MVRAKDITGRSATVCGFFALLLLLLAGSVYMAITHTPPGKWSAPRPLPLDAESLIRDFRFSHDFPGGYLTFTGKQLVRRGQKFFAVRSMIIKTNFFDDISGLYKDGRNKVEFDAERAEWDLVLDKPLDLKGIKHLRINGTDITNKGYASIYCSEHTVTVYGKKAKTYILKQ
ncbi:MAG: hypothetical protein ABSC19_10245 [Syntrophorhabdales bacterium]|jgi:hypothetical protein